MDFKVEKKSKNYDLRHYITVTSSDSLKFDCTIKARASTGVSYEGVQRFALDYYEKDCKQKKTLCKKENFFVQDLMFLKDS